MPENTPIHRELLEGIIFGPASDRRYTQDTPLLPDVWLAYARRPGRALGLILEPERDRRAGEAALAIRDRLRLFREQHPHISSSDPSSARERKSADIAHLPGIIVLRVYFDELINVVLPFTQWWRTSRDRFFHALDYDTGVARSNLGAQDSPGTARKKRIRKLVKSFEYLSMSERDKEQFHSSSAKSKDQPTAQLPVDVIRLAYAAGMVNLHVTSSAKELTKHRDDFPERCADSFLRLLEKFELNIEDTSLIGSIFRISRNRDAHSAVKKSTLACKADAARLLFNVSCKNITWAVADSGISHRHPAFHSWRENICGSRVVETYDFTRLRSVLSLDRPKSERARDMFDILLKGKGAGLTSEQEAKNEETFNKKLRQHIDELLNRIDKGFDVDWALLEPFIRLDQKDLESLPKSDHGTHVAGIIGADWPDPDAAPTVAAKRTGEGDALTCMQQLNEQELHQRRRGETDELSLSVRISDRKHNRVLEEATRHMIGMCPDIRLIDLRVLREGRDGIEGSRSDEFEVMAALQFVRHLNAKAGHMRVHGVNLSLSIEHDLANYACGRTPVCMECEELVSSGVVVVAAAGNKGYRNSGYTNVNDQGNYQSVSISDPGNADKVITVGSTHRSRPHDFGVSYFSSRGPTGDGRRKPDLVAPGEKINGPVRLVEAAAKDGTSMAAPHVSGAAAMLMARHPELIGKPEKIKEILCATATDLGREHYFQGSGMLDVLRALQSV